MSSSIAENHQRRPDAISTALLAAHFALVFAPVGLAAFWGPGWGAVGCWLWFGLASHGLLLFGHECIHKLAFRRVRLNELIAYWVMAPLFVTDFDALRARHWAHHRELGRGGDPKYTYRIDISGWRILGLALAALTGLGAARKFRHQVSDTHAGGSAQRALLRTALVQGLLVVGLAVIARLGHPQSWGDTGLALATAYAGVYVYGLISLTDLMHTLRGIAEHRRSEDDVLVEDGAALRNFSDGLLNRLIFGSYGFADHATHHHYPAVPSYRLPALTRALAQREPAYTPMGSHGAVLVQLIAGRQPAEAGYGGSSAHSSH